METLQRPILRDIDPARLPMIERKLFKLALKQAYGEDLTDDESHQENQLWLDYITTHSHLAPVNKRASKYSSAA